MSLESLKHLNTSRFYANSVQVYVLEKGILAVIFTSSIQVMFLTLSRYRDGVYVIKPYVLSHQKS